MTSRKHDTEKHIIIEAIKKANEKLRHDTAVTYADSTIHLDIGTYAVGDIFLKGEFKEEHVDEIYKAIIAVEMNVLNQSRNLSIVLKKNNETRGH